MKTVQSMLAEAQAAVPTHQPGRGQRADRDDRTCSSSTSASPLRSRRRAKCRARSPYRADSSSSAPISASHVHDAAFDRAKMVVCLLRIRRPLGTGRQDPEGHGLRQCPQPWRLQGLGRGRRAGREGLRCPTATGHAALYAAWAEPLALFAEDAGDPALSPASVYLGRPAPPRCRDQGPTCPRSFRAALFPTAADERLDPARLRARAAASGRAHDHPGRSRPRLPVRPDRGFRRRVGHQDDVPLSLVLR